MLNPEDPVSYQRKLYQQEDSKLSSFGILAFTTLIIIFIYADYAFFITSSEFVKLLSVRLILIAVSLILYAYLKVYKNNKYYSLIIFIWLMLFVSVLNYIGTTRPSEYLTHIAIDSPIILAVFILFRNKLLLQIVPALYLSIDMLLKLFFLKSIHIGLSYFVITISIVAINITGIFVSHTIAKFREMELRYLENEHEMQCELREMAFYDELTTLRNRRGILKSFKTEFERIKRYHKKLSLMILDIDDFKAINDRYGHDNGDIALKFFADTVSQEKRSIDHLGRIGGEEFILFLPETGMDEAQNVAKRILEGLNSKKIEFDGQKTKMTVSIGLTVVRNEDASIQECIRRADEYLYVAKERGKNNVYSGSV